MEDKIRVVNHIMPGVNKASRLPLRGKKTAIGAPPELHRQQPIQRTTSVFVDATVQGCASCTPTMYIHISCFNVYWTNASLVVFGKQLIPVSSCGR